MKEIDMENEVLSKFITQFFATSDRLRKSPYKHISYISDTINGVFLKFFGAENKINEEDIVDTFAQLGYRNIGDGSLWGKASSGMQESIYINVDTEKLRSVRLTLAALPDHTNPEKRENIENLKQRLNAFSKTRNDMT